MLHLIGLLLVLNMQPFSKEKTYQNFSFMKIGWYCPLINCATERGIKLTVVSIIIVVVGGGARAGSAAAGHLKKLRQVDAILLLLLLLTLLLQ